MSFLQNVATNPIMLSVIMHDNVVGIFASFACENDPLEMIKNKANLENNFYFFLLFFVFFYTIVSVDINILHKLWDYRGYVSINSFSNAYLNTNF
jgi:hypothetical protein